MRVVLHDIDAVRTRTRGAGVVHEDLALDRVNGDGADDVDLASIGQIEHRRALVRAGGQLLDAGAGGSLGAGDDLVGKTLQASASARDAAGAALFLASDLSAFVTGATVPVDGGTLASSGWFPTAEGGWTNRPRRP